MAALCGLNTEATCWKELNSAHGSALYDASNCSSPVSPVGHGGRKSRNGSGCSGRFSPNTTLESRGAGEPTPEQTATDAAVAQRLQPPQHPVPRHWSTFLEQRNASRDLDSCPWTTATGSMEAELSIVKAQRQRISNILRRWFYFSFLKQQGWKRCQ